MLTIPQHIIDHIVTYAQSQLPNEACGYLAGIDSDVSKSYLLTNIDQSPEHFSFDPAEQFSTVRDARKSGLELIANFHSHPETPARPSVEDIRLAYDPNISYVIISLMGEIPDVKSFRIKDGQVEKEDILIVNSTNSEYE